MKANLLICLLVVSGINFLMPEAFFVLVMLLLILITPYDDAATYNSSYSKILPFVFLVLIGIFGGLHNAHKDFYRDVFIFSKNSVYFIGGISLSKYIKNLNEFFKYFIIIAFASALIHLGLIITHLNSVVSLDTIRYAAGYGNEVEGIVVAVALSRLLNKDFRSLIDFTAVNKILIVVVTLSFLLYFSRTLIVLVIVVPLFLAGIINVRDFFSKKNARVLRVLVAIIILFYLFSVIATFQPPGSPLQTLVNKFERIPEEVGWNSQRNASATKEEIQENWRGYEAYQGLMKFYSGSKLQKAFGYGFSEKVDLGITIKLAGKDYTEVPILHNEYVTLLVKCGITGLLLYLFFLYNIGFRKVRYMQENTDIYFSYQMLSALSVISLLTTYIGFGLLDPKNSTIPLVLGFFWGNIQRQTQESIQQTPAIDFTLNTL
jgi:hypothetical protein